MRAPPVKSQRTIRVPAPNRLEGHMGIGFKYLLVDRDGEPRDPGSFVTATPQWNDGDSFAARDGSRWRIVSTRAMTLDDHTPFDGVWVVEPLD